MWIRRTSEVRSQTLEEIRNEIFSAMDIVRSDRILVLNAGHGLLVWEAFRRTPEGLVAAQVRTDEDLAFVSHRASELKGWEAPVTVKNLDDICADIRFEHIIGRNVFAGRSRDECRAILSFCASRCAQKTDLVLSETIPGNASRLSNFVHEGLLRTKLINQAQFMLGTEGFLKKSCLKFDA